MRKSVFDLNENVAAMLAYIGGFITGIIVLVLERENKTVRFAALQSIFWFGSLTLLGIALGWIFPLVTWIPLAGGIFRLIRSIITGLLTFTTIISWAYLSYSAYTGRKVKMPFFGDIVDAQINK
ncbi:MAG: hypothetical protein FWB71_00020 [Defluviitaleaceae bacterium]|nr:hypothetical protein [Defluviitaleaceae bacterium]